MPRTRFTQSQLEPVISDTLTTPPGSESAGDRYIIAGIGGAWSGFTIGDVVTVVDTGPTVWQASTPEEGDEVYINALQKYKTFKSGVWTLEGASNLEQLSDVSGASPTKGNILAANGTNWGTVTGGTDGQVLVRRNSPARGMQWEDITVGPLPCSRHSLSSDTGSIQATPQTLPFDREDKSDSISTNSSGEITINEDGTYLINVDVTIDELSGNNRTEFGSYLELDTGSGFAEVVGTQRRHYSRNNAQGASSASINVALVLNDGDIIRVRGLRQSGSSTGWWIADGSSITITRLTGIKGDQGPPGSGGGDVDSVNGQTGVVVLDTDDIAEGSTNLYYTETRVSNNTDVAANTTHRGRTDNPHSVTKSQVGLGNVDNVQQIPLSEKGSANGVATLDATGKVPSIQLPSFVDDVQEYANLAAFPGTGDAGIIYVALDTNKTYRWSGSAYVEISPSEVNSVNGQTGVVVLDADDIAETASRLWFTPAEDTKLAGIEAGATADQNADEVSFDNTGSDLSSTDVEAAVKEVNTKVNRQPDIVLMQVFT